jgi:hypothetical protein
MTNRSGGDASRFDGDASAHAYERRARLEAWALGSREKAVAKHLGKGWDGMRRLVQAVGVGGLVEEAEEEVRCMQELECFGSCADFYLCKRK